MAIKLGKRSVMKLLITKHTFWQELARVVLKEAFISHHDDILDLAEIMP